MEGQALIEPIAGTRAWQQAWQTEVPMTQEQMAAVARLLTLGWRPGGRQGQCMMTEQEHVRFGPCPVWTSPDGRQHSWEDALLSLPATTLSEKTDAAGQQTEQPLDPRD